MKSAQRLALAEAVFDRHLAVRPLLDKSTGIVSLLSLDHILPPDIAAAA